MEKLAQISTNVSNLLEFARNIVPIHLDRIIVNATKRITIENQTNILVKDVIERNLGSYLPTNITSGICHWMVACIP